MNMDYNQDKNTISVPWLYHSVPTTGHQCLIMSVGLNIKVFSELKRKDLTRVQLSLFKGLVEHVTTLLLSCITNIMYSYHVLTSIYCSSVVLSCSVYITNVVHHCTIMQNSIVLSCTTDILQYNTVQRISVYCSSVVQHTIKYKLYQNEIVQ